MSKNRLSTTVLGLVRYPNRFPGYGIIMSRIMDNSLKLEREKALLDELASLSKQQSEALQTAVYMRMEPKMAAQYDIRAKRIGELCKLIGDYKPK